MCRENRVALWSVLALLGLGSVGVSAAPSAVRPAVRPDAGSLTRELPTGVEAPSRGVDALPETADRPAQSLDATHKIAIRAVRITGNQSIAEPELQALVADALGRELTLDELDEVARRLTRHYRNAGYLLARAYLPAQEIKDGVVEMAILEGRLGKLSIDNQSGLSDSAVTARLSGLKEDKALSGPALERDILLLSDLPGSEVSATLKPGGSVGTTDLDVRLSPQGPYAGSLELDNYGNRNVGEWQPGGSLTVANLTGLGDTLSLRALASTGMRYARAAWQLPIGSAGTQLGAAWSEMRYTLGNDFSALDAHGTASIGSLYVLHPFIRSRIANLNGQAMLERKRLADDIDATDTRSRKSLNVWTLGLSGDQIDGLLDGGLSQVSISLASGQLDLDADNGVLDRAGHRTAGAFTRINLSGSRTQRLVGDFSLYANVRAQATNKNLDSAEKMALGGPQAVRAYPQGEAAADDAWLASLELRYALINEWQANLFYDSARGKLNHAPIAADGDNTRRLAGYGIGLARNAKDFSLQLAVAWRDGSQPTSDVDRQPRAWLVATQRF